MKKLHHIPKNTFESELLKPSIVRLFRRIYFFLHNNSPLFREVCYSAHHELMKAEKNNVLLISTFPRNYKHVNIHLTEPTCKQIFVTDQHLCAWNTKSNNHWRSAGRGLSFPFVSYSAVGLQRGKYTNPSHATIKYFPAFTTKLHHIYRRY